MLCNMRGQDCDKFWGIFLMISPPWVKILETSDAPHPRYRSNTLEDHCGGSTLVPPIAKIHTSESTKRNIIQKLLKGISDFLQDFVQKVGWMEGGGYLVSYLMLSPQIITL